MSEIIYDVIIVGGGQSALSTAYYLRRTGLNYLILDKESNPGGSWQHYWRSLRLFSPAQWSSLPGTLMEGGTDYYPTKDEVITYLRKYEERYDLPVRRSVEVYEIQKKHSIFHLETSAGKMYSKTVVSATGSFSNPFIPEIRGLYEFSGEVMHSAQYSSPESFGEKKVAVFGEGNSGAQILAELSAVTSTFWFTSQSPKFLPDHIDGRYLFDAATQMYEAKKKGKVFSPPSLGDIVVVDSVRQARERNVFDQSFQAKAFTKRGIITSDDEEIKIDVALFCTGFSPGLSHLKHVPLEFTQGKVKTKGTRSIELPGLWLVGYGGWTGFASATLIGVGRSARRTVSELLEYLEALSVNKR